MSALLTLIGLFVLLLLALACTVLVLVAIVLSLMPPEPEEPHQRPTGQPSGHGLRRGWRVFWPRDDKAVRAVYPEPSGRLHARGRPR